MERKEGQYENWPPGQQPSSLLMSVIAVHQIAGTRRVLQAAEGRLATERIAEFLIGDDLQHGIVAQAVGIVGVFVAGDDLVDALSQQFERIVTDALVLPRITEQRD